MNEKKREDLYKLAIQCFRDTADQDYIHARLAYQNKLIPQFLWSSLHCLEKYSKCMLVANGNKVINIGHKISPLINKFEEDAGLNIYLSTDVKDFIRRLDETAKYRYMTVSNVSKGYDLFLLDKSIHEIRRYCQQFSFEKEEKKSQVLELSNKNIEGKIKDIQRISLEGGVLERILKDKKHPARKALIYQNAFFSTRKRSTISIKKNITAYNSVFFQNHELFELAKQYIKIEPEVKKAYENEFGLPN